ncbi:hypothetical protein [Amycolatopsis tolypomycina]|uniref:hypothetical protein n=1 Tax=Amycolatopsis tolypomycina TaxID=208445 RepID=UPI0033A89129
MRHPKAVKTAKIAGGTGLVVTTLMTNSTGIALLAIAVVIAFCWVLDDHDRAKRLTMLVSTWRHGTSTPLRRRTVATPRRRAATAASGAIEKPPVTG